MTLQERIKFIESEIELAYESYKKNRDSVETSKRCIYWFRRLLKEFDERDYDTTACG